MSPKITVKTVQHWLIAIADSKRDSCYVNGIRLFLKDRNKKTLEEIKQLCEQIQEVTISEARFSNEVFGKKATSFFKTLDIKKLVSE